MTDPDGQDRGKASEAQPRYTHNPQDTQDKQSSRFYRRMVRVSRKLTAVIMRILNSLIQSQVTLFLCYSKNAHHYKSFDDSQPKLKLKI